MKNICKSAYLALCALLTLGLGACVEDFEYEGAAALRNAQAYFGSELPAQYELSTERSTLEIPVRRVKTDDELTLPVKVSFEENSIFGEDREMEIVFGRGKSEQTVTLEYDPQDITFGKYETVTVSIADASYTTDYGLTAYTFKAGATEWKPMGNGTLRDGVISTFYGLDNYVFRAVYEQNVIQPGVYRIVNPYRYHPYALLEDGSPDPDYYDTTTDHYLYIYAQDPDNVYVLMNRDGIGKTGLTLNASEGEIGFISRVQREMLGGASVADIKAQHPEYFGQLKNNVISFPAGAFLGTLTTASGTQGYYGPLGDGLMTLALPGGVIADYSFGYTTSGTFVDSRGNEFIEGRFTLGTDVAELKYALTTEEALDAKFDEILAGGEAASVTAAGSVRLAVEGSGTYYLAMVAYNAAGEAVGQDYATIKFQSTHEGGESWDAVGTGIYTYTTADFSADQGGGIWQGSQEATLFRSSADASRYMISPWADNEEGSGKGLVFSMDADGKLTVDGAETGWEYSTYGMVTATDLVTAGVANMPSSYAGGVFTFNLAYQVEASSLVFVQDTFELTGTSQSPGKAKGIRRSAKTQRKLTYSLRSMARRIVNPF